MWPAAGSATTAAQAATASSTGNGRRTARKGTCSRGTSRANLGLRRAVHPHEHRGLARHRLELRRTAGRPGDPRHRRVQARRRSERRRRRRARLVGRVTVRALAASTEVGDLAAMFDLYRVHYGEVADAGQTASWLETNLRGGRLEAFVAEDSGESIGFATAMVVPASLRLGLFWQIRDLFVLPDHRRLGVGRALLEAV